MNPCCQWRGNQPRTSTTVAAQAAADEQQAAADDPEGAVLAAWDDGWGGPLEVEEDPAAEIWFDYEVQRGRLSDVPRVAGLCCDDVRSVDSQQCFASKPAAQQATG